MATPIALSIAGSDPSGGAGIQADLKTFHAHGIYGEAVVTLLTVQNSEGVRRVEPVAPELIAAQLRAVLEDIPPHAIKTGALPSALAAQAIANELHDRPIPLVVDPILRPTAGVAFAQDDLARAYLDTLAPIAALLTPNAVEASLLSGIEVRDEGSAVRAAERLLATGCGAILIKGGHLAGEPCDVLLTHKEREVFRAARVDTRHTHGTGCTYAAAITARLARGRSLASAVGGARAWLSRVMAQPLGLGRGHGPLNHLVPVDPDEL